MIRASDDALGGCLGADDAGPARPWTETGRSRPPFRYGRGPLFAWARLGMSLLVALISHLRRGLGRHLSCASGHAWQILRTAAQRDPSQQVQLRLAEAPRP